MVAALDTWLAGDTACADTRVMGGDDFATTDTQALDDSARRMTALLRLSRGTRGIAEYRRVQERIIAEGKVYLECLRRCYRHG